jgi:predicted transcriptional regulator
MADPADPLDLLFPVVRAEILRALFVDTRREMYVREIARTAELALRTVQRELAILKKTGLVTSRSNGYHLFFRANRSHILFSSLQKLAAHSASYPAAVRKERKSPRQSWRRSRTRRRR